MALGLRAMTAAVVHAAHHVCHGQPLDRVQRGNRRTQTLADSQRAAGVASAIHGLRVDGVDVVRGLHQHVAGLARAEPKLVNGHGFHVLPVHLHHGELEAR